MTEIWETTEKVVLVLPSGEKEVDGPVTADQIRAFARDEGIRKFTVHDGECNVLNKSNFPISSGKIIIKEYNEAK